MASIDCELCGARHELPSNGDRQKGPEPTFCRDCGTKLARRAEGVVSDDAPPDSVMPLDSRDFIEVGFEERRALHPPPKLPTKRSPEASELVLADPFAQRDEASTATPPPEPQRQPATQPEKLLSEAPVVRTALDAAPRRAPLERLALGFFLFVGGALTVNQILNRDVDSESARSSAGVRPAVAGLTLVAPPESRSHEPKPGLAQPDPPPQAPLAVSLSEPARPRRAPVGLETVAVAPEPAETAPDPDAAAVAAGDNAAPALDRNAIDRALTAAAEQAKTCRKSSDPSGMAVVTITFSATGRATSANVSGPPFAGTETGGCIATALRSARVPAFSGDFVTVRKTIVVD